MIINEMSKKDKIHNQISARDASPRRQELRIMNGKMEKDNVIARSFGLYEKGGALRLFTSYLPFGGNVVKITI
jgi:hypothetical protein